jgi:hypothetical protein
MFAVATLATLALALRASAFTVSTPSSLTLCQDATFDIIGGNSGDQYTAYFVHGDDPCGDELFHLSNLSGDHFNWKVNVTAGTSVMVALDNGHDDEQWTGAVTVTGDDTSCLTGASPAASSSTSTTQTSTHAAATYTAPVNAASSAPSATNASTSGASRAAFAISSVLAVLGVAAVGLTL